jgi:hypothetical protein
VPVWKRVTTEVAVIGIGQRVVDGVYILQTLKCEPTLGLGLLPDDFGVGYGG